MHWGEIIAYEGIYPEIADDVFLAPGSFVIGKVKIGKSASIWYNAVIRGDNDSITIGELSNIQDNAVIHVNREQPVNIGQQVLIGHSCVLHACTVEDFTLIGMRAVIMDQAIIGRGSIIGAGTLILPKTVIPPYSVVAGSPGKIIKTIDEATAVEARTKQNMRYSSLAHNHIEALKSK